MAADTMDALMRIFGWSMNVLLSGETPLKDYAGRDIYGGGGASLSNGYRGCLVQCRGDWEFYCQLFYFGTSTSDRCCWLCQASATEPDKSWTDFSSTARWRLLLWTHEEYINLLRASGFAIPVLFLVVLGFRLECIRIDVLHAVDQGLSSHIVGNVICHIGVIRNCFGG